MSQQIFKISVSEPPRDPNNLNQCMKDFYDFIDRKPDRVASYFGSLIREYRINENYLKNLSVYKEQLEKVDKLFSEKREQAAFDLFFRSFPTCLPHRSPIRL
ncbi:MAG: hypothetical protein ACFFKA_15075 [Candidatus Thorarchaeota archaeon]